MLPEERKHLEELLTIYQENLRILEIQSARLGSNTPPAIPSEIKELKNKIKNVQDQLKIDDISDPYPNYLQFVNQREALNTISEYSQANNFVIDAPAGYGKTRLLAEFKNHRTKEGWYTYLISFGKFRGVGDKNSIIAFIVEHFGISYNPKSHNMEIHDVSGKVANRLRTLSSNSFIDEKQVGCILIFDEVEKIANKPDDRSYLDLRAFFDGIRDISADFQDYKLLIILSGRYISHFPRILGGSVPVILKVFDLSVIEQAIDGFFTAIGMRRKSEWFRELAQHILFVTGGHPGMVEQVLVTETIGIRHYPSGSFRKWIPENKDKISEIISITIEKIKNDISDLWEVLETLCVFRRISRHIIKQLFPQGLGNWNTPFELTDELLKSRLVVRIPDTDLFKDGVLRPAIVSWLQFSNPVKLKKYCDKAYGILTAELLNTTRSIPVVVIFKEILYITLLQQHHLIFIDASDTDRGNFLADITFMMKKNLDEYIEPLSGKKLDKEQIADLSNDLIESLLHDTELAFLFDYIFGSVQPYGDFVHELCDVDALGA